MMRALLLTPYAPDRMHYHAAADTVTKLVPRLAQKTELFVYSPQNGPTERPGLGYTLLPSNVTGRPGPPDRLGLAPGWLRADWPRAATVEAARLVARLKPDVVHGEYLQSAEILGRYRNTVLGLHDITEQVMRESYRASSVLHRPYRLAELVRTRRFERGAIIRAGAVLALSDADLATVSAVNPRAWLARPGVDIDDRVWSVPRREPPRLVFAGALWRRANALVARYLIREVMPIVWQALPSAELRLVGAEPTPDVVERGREDGRIVVTGAVGDIRAEMLDAHAVVVPSIVGGGVLMKVAHAMALGCPVITSPGPAASVRGDPTMLFIASTSAGVAQSVRTVVTMPDEAVRRGRRARTHIGQTFRWDETVRAYLDAYASVSKR
jgi:glycosyltransferase involved in cell wall biosynthesis